MRALWIGMGLWVRWVILGVMRGAGLMAVTSLILKCLYRNKRLAQKPLWVAFAYHLVLILFGAWIVYWIGCRMWA